MVLVVRARLGQEEAPMAAVSDPSTFGHGKELTAELSGQGREPGTHLVHRESRPACIDLCVHRVRATRIPIRVPALPGGTRLADRKLGGDGNGDLVSGQQVPHQLAAGPAMGAPDRGAELIVRQVGERFEWSECGALRVEECTCVDVHAGIV